MSKRSPAPAVRREKRPDGTLYAVAGASRSGKTAWIAQRVAREQRLLVWDYPKGEWGIKLRCRRVTDFRELAQLVVPGAPPARLAFARRSETAEQDFAAFCRIAWVYVVAHGAPLVVEETASVTHPGKAPAPWGNIIRMGLGYGSDIYAVTQRPAESDKTALGNATVVHCGRLQIPDDRATMARYLDVPVADISALRPLQFIERHASGALVRGMVSFRKARR